MNDNVIDIKGSTYSMRLACMNCFSEWEGSITKGTLVRNWKGVCPTCGCREYHPLPKRVMGGALQAAQPYPLTESMALQAMSEREMMLKKIEDEARRQINAEMKKGQDVQPLPEPLP